MIQRPGLCEHLCLLSPDQRRGHAAIMLPLTEVEAVKRRLIKFEVGDDSPVSGPFSSKYQA